MKMLRMEDITERITMGRRIEALKDQIKNTQSRQREEVQHEIKLGFRGRRPKGAPKELENRVAKP